MTTEATFDEQYFSGQRLYGDDFDQERIDVWFEAEQEGYANLSEQPATPDPEAYGYDNFNRFHLFRHLPSGPLGDALGFGAAYGGELLPLLDRLSSVTIVEPSQVLRSPHLRGRPVDYIDPLPTGDLPFDGARFDLTTCLGVLHHIPNVSKVVAELARVTRPGGYVLIREPMTSMGDWRQPRAGLTAKERGIPRGVMLDIVSPHFEVANTSIGDFPLRSRLPGPVDAKANVLLDTVLARAFSPNYRYHATSTWQKLRPRQLALVLRKPSA